MALIHIGMSPRVYRQFKIHAHACYEIILNLEGEGMSMTEDGQHAFCPGSIVIIPIGMRHTKTSGDGFRDIYIHADTLPATLNEALSQGALYFEDDENKTITALMHMMRWRYLGDTGTDMTLQAMFELLLMLLCEKCIASCKDPIAHRVQQRLASHFSDPELQLSSLLESTGYTKDHIRRKFVAAYGLTPREYVQRLRIEQAKKMLQNRKSTHYSIADIGAQCGYYDGRYFSRIFKKREGISPEEFAERES